MTESNSEAYLKGYELGKNIESLNRHRVKTANANFERWRDRNEA